MDKTTRLTPHHPRQQWYRPRIIACNSFLFHIQRLTVDLIDCLKSQFPRRHWLLQAIHTYTYIASSLLWKTTSLRSYLFLKPAGLVITGANSKPKSIWDPVLAYSPLEATYLQNYLAEVWDMRASRGRTISRRWFLVSIYLRVGLFPRGIRSI